MFTKPLPGNGRGHKHADLWEGFMKYAVEVGSDAMIYVPRFIKIGSGIQKLMQRGNTHIDTWQRGDPSLILFLAHYPYFE
jgi:hypothetical protein